MRDWIEQNVHAYLPQNYSTVHVELPSQIPPNIPLLPITHVWFLNVVFTKASLSFSTFLRPPKYVSFTNIMLIKRSDWWSVHNCCWTLRKSWHAVKCTYLLDYILPNRPINCTVHSLNLSRMFNFPAPNTHIAASNESENVQGDFFAFRVHGGGGVKKRW